MARTAVIAGTAQAVAGRVAAGQGAAQHQAAQQQAAAHQAATAQQAAQQPAPPPNVNELHAQLLKLGELRQAGLLTDGEFEQQKARLLTP
ncbi:MAG TPA: SHOCT domain-containing protein [Pseudonocardia sp.]